MCQVNCYSLLSYLLVYLNLATTNLALAVDMETDTIVYIFFPFEVHRNLKLVYQNNRTVDSPKGVRSSCKGDNLTKLSTMGTTSQPIITGDHVSWKKMADASQGTCDSSTLAASSCVDTSRSRCRWQEHLCLVLVYLIYALHSQYIFLSPVTNWKLDASAGNFNWNIVGRIMSSEGKVVFEFCGWR